MKTPVSFGTYSVPFFVTTAFFILGFFLIPEVWIGLATVYLIATIVVGYIAFSRIIKRNTKAEKIVEAGNARTLYILAIVFFMLFLNGLGFIMWRTDPFWVKLSFIQDEANFVFVCLVTVIVFLLFLSALNVCYRAFKALNSK